MSNTIGRFDFEIDKMGKGDGSLPLPPQVRFTIDHHGQSRSGMPTISETLTSAAEIDRYVTEAKADLDAVAKRAKAALLRANAETESIVNDRISKLDTTDTSSN